MPAPELKPTILDPFTCPLDKVTITYDVNSSESQHLLSARTRLNGILRTFYWIILFNIPTTYFPPLYALEQEPLSNPSTSDNVPQGLPSTSDGIVQELSSKAPISEIPLEKWTKYVDDLSVQWQILGVVSSLFVSSILSMFQLTVINYPIPLMSSFLAFISALMSLICASYYAVQFGNMKAEWAALKFIKYIRATNGFLWWNPMVMLSLPMVSLCWSILLVWFGLLWFLWARYNIGEPASGPEPLGLAAPIAVTVVFAIGVFYLFLILSTFSRHLSFSYSKEDQEDFEGRGSNPANDCEMP